MTTQDEVRQDLADEIFNSDIAKAVSIINKSSPIYNSRGEIEDYSTSATSVNIVPYNITDKELTYEGFGNFEVGDMMVAMPYDTVINNDDVLIIEDEFWSVKSIEKNYLPDNIVTIVMITRSHETPNDVVFPLTFPVTLT